MFQLPLQEPFAEVDDGGRIANNEQAAAQVRGAD